MAEIAPMGMLDEHAPRPKDDDSNNPPSYEPTGDERRTIKLVEKLFEKAKKHRALYDEKWLDYYRFFRGKQWKDQRPSYRHSEVVNLVFRTIQSMVPIQVDSRPRFEFLPQEPADQELAEILNQVAEADWVKNNWGEQLLEVIYDSNFYGTGLSKMVARELLGTLRLVYESADPFYSFPDPDARDTNKDCGWFIYAEPTDVAKVKRRYSDKRDFIKPDLQDLLKGAKTDFAPIKFRSPVDNKVVMEGGNTQDLVEKDKALLITCWMSAEFLRDEFEEVAKEIKDPETGSTETIYEQVARYPNGRKVVICNGVLLEDAPLGYDDGEIPFQRYANYLLPREFWGISEVEQLEGPQKTFNKLVSFALDVLTIMGNPIWVVSTDSGVDPENLTNRPGLIVEKNPGSEVERKEGAQLQPFVLQMIDRMAEWFDSIGGSQDVTRGVQPTGVTAASAISTLQEAAQTRIRQKARNLDYYLQNVGLQYLSRLFQFKTAPEIYRITNKDGSQQYFRMHVEHYDKTAKAIDPATGLPVQVPTGEMGKRMHVQPVGPSGYDPTQARVYEVRAEFDVKVSTGSTLPFAKAEKEQRLLNLFDRGIVDDAEVLKGIDYPNWEAVLQRMEQKKAAQAQAEMMAKAGGGGQPPPAA